MDNKWKTVKIAEVGDVVGGGTPSTKEKLFYGGDIQWITPRDLSGYENVYIGNGERTISRLGLQNSGARLLPKGTVLFSSRAPIGYIAIASNELSTNQGFKSVICKKDVVANVFLYYKLKENKDNIENIASGSTFKEVSGEVLGSFEITIPESLTEQRAIAKTLYDLDRKIELNRQMNKTLEEIGKARFIRLFVEENKCSKPVRLAELIDLDPPVKLRKGEECFHVDMGELSKENMSVENTTIKQYSGGAKYQNRDTLLARITPCLENGKTAFVDFLPGKDIVGSGSTEFIVMRAKKGISPQFVYYLARDDDFRSFAMKSMVGSSGRQRVQRVMIEGYEMRRPNHSQMDEFNRITEPLFNYIRILTQEIISLREIRDSLLPKLISGKIRVGSINL